MKTVYLHGKLGKRFGKKWSLNVNTVQEAYSAIEANSDGFFEYIFKASNNGIDYITLTKNPEHIQNEDDLKENLIDTELGKLKNKSSEIHIVSPSYGSGVIMPILFVGGAISGGLTAVGMVVVSLAISYAINALTKTPEPPKKKDPITSKSFLIAGASTRQAQGIAVPVGYGRLKIGATNIATRKQSQKLVKYKPSKKALLESYTEMEFVDLISEGPIHGFVNKHGATLNSDDIVEGIYLNEVQVKNTPRSPEEPETFNYILNENQDTVDGRPIYKDGRESDSKILSKGVFYVRDYDLLIYGPPPYKYEKFSIEGAIKHGGKVVSHFISNPAVNEVTISLRTELSHQDDDGEMHAIGLMFGILISREGEDYNVLEPNSSGCEIIKVGHGVTKKASFEEFDKQLQDQLTQQVGSEVDSDVARKLKSTLARSIAKNSSEVKNAHFEVRGIATSTYQFDITLKIDRSNLFKDSQHGLTLKILKLVPEYDPSVKGGKYGGIGNSRRLQLAHVEEKISENLLYPHSAMVKILVDSKNFSQSPDRSYHVKLKKVLIPSNYDPVSRKYKGPWDGLFKGQSGSDESIHSISDENKYWTDNPAWVFFDLLYNPRYGVGKYGLEEENIDKWQLYKIAKYCDELVETDYPIETISGNPRRFTCRNIINQSTEPDSVEIEIDFLEYVTEIKEYEGEDSDVSSLETQAILTEGNESNVDLFAKEFGDQGSFKGKKIAFFMHQMNGQISDDQIAYRSVAREGEIIIEERVIINSDPESYTITVSGPGFPINSSDSSITIGACVTQINHPVVEPRFSANLYLTDRAEALEIIKNLASIFRGMTAYSSGKILATQDRNRSPIQLFNNSNVSKDGFSYSGMDKTKKNTVSLVRFNNESKNYRPDLIYEEDADAIQKFGYIEKEALAFGVTSESQARRLAKWILVTAQTEVDIIRFTAGQEAQYLYPGCVFEVSDETRVGKTKSGRLLDIKQTKRISLNGQTFDVSSPYLLLDKPIEDNIAISNIEIVVSAAKLNSSLEMIEKRSSFEVSEEDQDVEIESVNTAQVYMFDAMLGVMSDNKNSGPQGQRTIAYNLILKTGFDVDLGRNLIKKVQHGMEHGQQIIFKSEGVLPGGLNKGRIYYVVNPTKNTFQVSLIDPSSGTYSIINIIDVGRNEILSKGGNHYYCAYSGPSSIDETTQAALDQLSPGSTYLIKGLTGVRSDIEISSNLLKNNLKIETEFGSNWCVSLIFGLIFVGKNDGWIFSFQLNEWINAKNIISNGLQQNAWFYSSSLGWVYIKERDDDDYFWYIANEEEFIFVKEKSEYFYRYNSLTDSVSIGDLMLIADKTYYVKNVINGHGFFFSFIDNSDTFDDSAPDTISDENIESDNPGLKTAEISDILTVSADNSAQGRKSLRVQLEDGHDLNLQANDRMFISDFSSENGNLNNLMNKDEWYVLFINKNTVELIDSEQEYEQFNLAPTINDYGKISFIENAKTKIDRYLDSQLFRLLSVKEVPQNNYEIVGLEYNSSKFDVVDKKGVIRRPHLPIPPQADMAIPEAPTDLILKDLTQ